MRVGIEVGGTFTDLVAFDGVRVEIAKVPSTPASPDVGAFSALVAARIAPASVTDLVHGSTVATNAILERKGARLAFVTTKGFRDILFLQRHDRRNIYDLRYSKPLPPVNRGDCFEVDERLSSSGEIVRSLDEAEIERALLPALETCGYQAVAICLLSAYASPVHEQRLKQCIVRAFPRLRVACSHEITREFREFERASTTVLSAYVQPVIDGYLDRFEATLAKAGFQGHFSVMQSNGGRLPAVAMRRNSITALFSGPAAGVVGAIRQAGRSGYKNLITFDMGGTSTDVSLVTDGKPSLAPETEVDGLPIRTPVLDIISIGAGGGSLIWIDEGGMLRVGPRSAGAEPGPACYGRGGGYPTVTDAHLVRGTIRADAFLGGAMPLYPDRAYAALASISSHLGTDAVGAANAAIRLTVANIVRAIQLVSTERGKDPRSYSLIPFGGAGPLVACEIAEELGIPEVVVPPNPGVVSALGLLSADFLKVAGTTCRTDLDENAPSVIRQEFARFRTSAEAEFRELGLDGELDFSLIVDMRFAGQAFEIPVEIDPALLPSLRPSDLAERFTETHRRLYFHGGEPGRRVDLVCLRLGVRRPLKTLPDFRERAGSFQQPEMAEVRSAAGGVRARLVDAAAMRPQDQIDGPVLIEGYSSSTWVPTGWIATRDAHDNTIIRRYRS